MNECVTQNTQQKNFQIVKWKMGRLMFSLAQPQVSNDGNLPTASFSCLSRCERGKYKLLDLVFFFFIWKESLFPFPLTKPFRLTFCITLYKRSYVREVALLADANSCGCVCVRRQNSKERPSHSKSEYSTSKIFFLYKG